MTIQHAPRISVTRDPQGAEKQLPDGHVRKINFLLGFDRADRLTISFTEEFRVTAEELKVVNEPWSDEEADALFLQEINRYRVYNVQLGRLVTHRESMIEFYNRRRNGHLTSATAPELKILSARIIK
jgi:hypothetical protein